MSVAVNELQTLLTMLLPGFVTAAILYLFTSFSKPSPFERVIQALVFSFAINAIAGLFEWLSVFESVPDIVLYFVLAILLGVIVVYTTNHDWLYRSYGYFGLPERLLSRLNGILHLPETRKHTWYCISKVNAVSMDGPKNGPVTLLRGTSL